MSHPIPINSTARKIGIAAALSSRVFVVLPFCGTAGFRSLFLCPMVFAVLVVVVHRVHHVHGSPRIFQLPQSQTVRACPVRYSTIFYVTLVCSTLLYSTILYPTLLILSSTLLDPIAPARTLPNPTQPCPTLLHALTHSLFLSAGPPWQAFWRKPTRYLTIRAGRTCAGGGRTGILW